MKWLESITQVSLGLWAGAMGGFAATAPLLFSAFGSERQRAGDLAGAMIWRLNSVGLVLGALSLLALLPRLKSGLNRWRVGLITGALALSLAGALYIFPQMEKARPPVPIEQLGPNDPARVDYNRWHKASERIFGVAILLGACALFLGPLGKEGRH